MSHRVATPSVGGPLSGIGHGQDAGRAHAGCARGYYLRLSITEACGYRCSYCQPQGPGPCNPDRLSAAEIERAVRALCASGVHRVRLTGGEPLSRPDCVEIVERLKRIEGIHEIALTTNGRRLAALAPALAKAGLGRVNLHLDSLKSATFASVVGFEEHARVLEGLKVARAVGLGPLKINVVVMRGVNDDEILDLCEFARREALCVRFIELMDTGVAASYSHQHFFSADEIRGRIAQRYRLRPRFLERGASPATEYLLGPKTDAGLGAGAAAGEALAPAVVGIIASESEPFCERCNRLRLSATGRLRGCLYEAGGLSLREALRATADPDRLSALIRQGLQDKRSHHPPPLAERLAPGMAAEGPPVDRPEGPHFSMASIGG